MNIEVVQGDITKIEIDVIVNAANSSLLGGSGVDGAIHRAGGKAILEACQHIRNAQGKCNVGEVVITTAGNLPAKKVIHTVGPVYNGGDRLTLEKELLSNCYRNSLQLAKENNLESIAFPNISTGIYRFPKDLAAKIAIQAVKENPVLEKVIFVCFDEENYKIYKEIIKK
ncbi:O-acetyl-ADP-ribose deacetylase [Tenacibaculum agarivorans]|uniref:O-acetyl-ADP-ribose deacetylase n=1 Tax=Tenacibaculum agarivorans TaxID=1908389 RepID=UPI00094B9A65|nr:O-acetyl-ADP-ribose deacetylase [Tenacibaculum agarivorans]